MSYILNIETSTTNCSVTISNKGNLILENEINDGNYTHSTKLHSLISNLIEKSKISLSKISAIAISKGPGSYTGLRIGTAAAKGLCYALDIPLIAISTLKILANKLKVQNGLIVPVMDARRDEVYSAVFDSKLNIIKKPKPEIIHNNSFLDIAKKGKIYLVGSGQEKCKRIINENPNLVYSEDKIFPSSLEMIDLSYDMFLDLNFEDIAYFKPDYLKDFQTNKLNR